jgi:3-methyladenine DNA glycosylase AlkD
MTLNEAISELKLLATPEHFAQLERFGIKSSKAIGVKVPSIRNLAKKIGIDHELALELWATEIHEARLLASMIEDARTLSEKQFDEWTADFDSWDMCDVTCDLFGRSPLVFNKIHEYTAREEEFVKRCGFALMCELSFHNKKIKNEDFYPFFDLIEREAWDNRNFVRKAVNWALRQIGKRNEVLRIKAIECAERVLKQETKSARWIATDTLRELNNPKIIARTVKK